VCNDFHPSVLFFSFSCFEANLNGEFYSATDSREEFRSIIWEHWLGDEPLKGTELKIRSPSMITRPQDQSAEMQPESVTPLNIPEDP
jgi:hypothetical protein